MFTSKIKQALLTWTKNVEYSIMENYDYDKITTKTQIYIIKSRKENLNINIFKTLANKYGLEENELNELNYLKFEHNLLYENVLVKRLDYFEKTIIPYYQQQKDIIRKINDKIYLRISIDSYLTTFIDDYLELNSISNIIYLNKNWFNIKNRIDNFKKSYQENVKNIKNDTASEEIKNNIFKYDKYVNNLVEMSIFMKISINTYLIDSDEFIIDSKIFNENEYVNVFNNYKSNINFNLKINLNGKIFEKYNNLGEFLNDNKYIIKDFNIVNNLNKINTYHLSLKKTINNKDPTLLYENLEFYILGKIFVYFYPKHKFISNLETTNIDKTNIITDYEKKVYNIYINIEDDLNQYNYDNTPENERNKILQNKLPKSVLNKIKEEEFLAMHKSLQKDITKNDDDIQINVLLEIYRNNTIYNINKGTKENIEKILNFSDNYGYKDTINNCSININKISVNLFEKINELNIKNLINDLTFFKIIYTSFSNIKHKLIFDETEIFINKFLFCRLLDKYLQKDITSIENYYKNIIYCHDKSNQNNICIFYDYSTELYITDTIINALKLNIVYYNKLNYDDLYSARVEHTINIEKYKDYINIIEEDDYNLLQTNLLQIMLFMTNDTNDTNKYNTIKNIINIKELKDLNINNIYCNNYNKIINERINKINTLKNDYSNSQYFTINNDNKYINEVNTSLKDINIYDRHKEIIITNKIYRNNNVIKYINGFSNNIHGMVNYKITDNDTNLQPIFGLIKFIIDKIIHFLSINIIYKYEYTKDNKNILNYILNNNNKIYLINDFTNKQLFVKNYEKKYEEYNKQFLEKPLSENEKEKENILKQNFYDKLYNKINKQTISKQQIITEFEKIYNIYTIHTKYNMYNIDITQDLNIYYYITLFSFYKHYLDLINQILKKNDYIIINENTFNLISNNLDYINEKLKKQIH